VGDHLESLVPLRPGVFGLNQLLLELLELLSGTLLVDVLRELLVQGLIEVLVGGPFADFLAEHCVSRNPLHDFVHLHFG